jgi:hypothetical protein
VEGTVVASVRNCHRISVEGLKEVTGASVRIVNVSTKI